MVDLNLALQDPPHEGEPERDESTIEQRETIGLSQGQIVRKRFFRHRGAVISIFVLAFVIVLAYTSVGLHLWGLSTTGWWPWHWRETPPLVNRGIPTLNLIPGPGFGIGPHPFGQDVVGHDIFALVMRGAQQSIMIMVLVGSVGTMVGVFIGSLAGFYRGWSDSLLMRFTDVIITIPFIVIGAVIGRSTGSLGAAVLGLMLGLFAWTGLARLVRGEFLSLREREFIDAARVSGASDKRIIFKHILPNAVGVIIVSATLLMAGAILGETALSFLGFGVKSPDTSLGLIVAENQAAFATRPWLFWWPGVFIIVIALSVNFIGDGLRDAFDPRQKKMPSPRALARAAVRRARDKRVSV
ncbi:ABC transporter permease [Cryobacterium sp. Sr8]|uniref:Peptide/nickel transport system permease protein n=1 Tax=Cryobacterium psychrotolerans TaxID=386301 RepID=A0A1G8XRK7_9MICO|nr:MULTISPECIES: ABC transporter permease [Cryobacterium]TFD80122.1 ABC transporter permease [Cryobacterium sp. Sr8]TFD82840.1 ABC transporter permease [Cryobacterium psychrotolerans]SDJ92390.1 peptide/nickel transport system permease protein [Cryobacterium psychrotolerans]